MKFIIPRSKFPYDAKDIDSPKAGTSNSTNKSNTTGARYPHPSISNQPTSYEELLAALPKIEDSESDIPDDQAIEDLMSTCSEEIEHAIQKDST